MLVNVSQCNERTVKLTVNVHYLMMAKRPKHVAVNILNM
jgi:hypothetical protein